LGVLEVHVRSEADFGEDKNASHPRDTLRLPQAPAQREQKEKQKRLEIFSEPLW
jgi:hypothetical protein